MAPKTEDLDLDLPAQMLELGEMLSSVGSFRRVSPRQPGAKQPDVPQVEAFVNMVLTKATKDATARRLLGLRQNRDADRIRIKAVAILAWHALRLSSDSADLGELAASTADPKLPPFEALLRARNELGAAIAVDVIIGRTDGSDGPIRKAHLPGRTLEWLSGGKASMGHLTTSKLMGRLMPKGYDEPEEQTPAPAKIPSAKELRTLICERVIGLDEQVSALSSRLVMHLARAKMLRAGNDPGTGNQAILLAGNSGCGKTWLMEVAAKASHCPFASLSATAMTSEGFVGGKLDDLFRALVGKAKGEVQVARFGIAFADEWDKKASRFGRDVTTLAVTQEVLVPMQGGEFLISGKRSMERPVVFNSHGTFFAFAGAFDGLAELIRKKAGRTCIGFSAGTRTKQQEFILDAIRDYGYIREWVNRLTAVMFLPDPQLGSLEEAAAGGVLDSFNALVGELGIVLFPHGRSIARMAEYALESGTFFRGVKSVWWSLAASAVASGKGTVLVGDAEVEAAIGRVASGSASGAGAATAAPLEDSLDTPADDGAGTSEAQ